MPGESKILNTEMGLMNYQQARFTSGEWKMSTETGFSNYGHDRSMSAESKMFEIETGLMNYQYARCMSGGSKMLTETDFTNY